MTIDKEIDPRGYRFGAAISFAGAAAAVLVGGEPGAALLAVLALLFLPGAIIGPQATLQALLFRFLVRPRMGPPLITEPLRPARFAQQIGLGLSSAGAVLGLVGQSWAVPVFGGLVVAASFLNAAFGFCLGCEIYLAAKRSTSR